MQGNPVIELLEITCPACSRVYAAVHGDATCPDCDLRRRSMRDEAMLERAIYIACGAHNGQIDKAGAPYILHPLRVMMSLETTDEKTVGVLHDVAEDCPDWNLERIKHSGFPEHIVKALDSVTRRCGETYEEFILRAEANQIGRRVKIADLHDNMDLSRIAVLTPKDAIRTERYRLALLKLQSVPVSVPVAEKDLAQSA